MLLPAYDNESIHFRIFVQRKYEHRIKPESAFTGQEPFC